MPSNPLPGASGELARRTRRIADTSTTAAQATELRAKLRQATVTGWVPYAAGPPEQPAGVTVAEFGAAIIPVLGGRVCAVDDSVWLISNGRGRWLCLPRLDFGDPDPVWVPVITQTTTRAGTPDETVISKTGRWVSATLHWTSTVAGSAAALNIGFPGGYVPSNTTFGVVGHGYINNGANQRVIYIATATGIGLLTADGGGLYATALAIGHVLIGSFHYPAAT